MKKLFKQTLCVIFVLLILGISVGEVESQEAYFLENSGQNPIIRLFNEASETIFVTAYVITSSEIAKALVNAKSNGVDVKVLLDERQAMGNKFSLHHILIKGGIEVKAISSESGRVVSDSGIIDGKIVYTGGTLLHTNIRKNPKLGNYIVFRDNEEIVEKYQSEFFKLFEQARDLDERKR